MTEILQRVSTAYAGGFITTGLTEQVSGDQNTHDSKEHPDRSKEQTGNNGIEDIYYTYVACCILLEDIAHNFRFLNSKKHKKYSL